MTHARDLAPSAADAPDVTISVVTFDRPHLLRRALASIAAQTLPADRFEVVVVNDAGIDPSSVVAEFADRLQIRLVQHERNLGVAAAVNTSIIESRGRYLCFLADDDLYYPRHVEALLERAEAEGGATLVYSDGIQALEDDLGTCLARNMFDVPAEFQRDRLLVVNYIPALCFIVPRTVFEQVGLFDERFEALEDWEMWLRATERFNVARLLEPTAEYRVRVQSRTNNTTRERPRHFTNLERLYSMYPAPHVEAERALHLQNSRVLLEQHAFALSIVIAGTDDVAPLMRSLGSVVSLLGDNTSFEVVLHVPRTPQVEAFVGELDGDVTVVYGDAAPTDAWPVLKRKAAGAFVIRLESGSVLTLEMLQSLRASLATEAA